MDEAPGQTQDALAEHEGDARGAPEAVSLVNCREIEDWSRECSEYRPPLVTAANAFAVALALFVGCLPGLASIDRKTHGGWWGFVVCAALVASVTMLGAGAYLLAVRVPRISWWLAERGFLHERPAARHLVLLADRMERAKDANRLPRASLAPELVEELTGRTRQRT